MSIAAIVRALVAAKATPEMILAAVEAAEAGQVDALAQSRAKARARVQKWRERKGGNVTERNETSRNDLRAGVTRVEDNLQTQKISGQEENKHTNAPKARGSDLDAFKAELAPDLDAERIEAIVKHRRAKRGQLTALSARLFAKDAQACGLSLSDAVDACISRNWITVKPEYFAHKSPRTSTGPPNRKRNFVDVARDRYGNGSADFSGNRGDDERLSARLIGP